MQLRNLIVVFLALSAVSAARRVVYETRASELPLFGRNGNDEWMYDARSQSDEMLELVVAIKQTNLDVLDELLMEVSDPDSPSYGEHASFETIGTLFRDDESVRTVRKWLEAHGVQHDVTLNGEFAKVTLTVAEAEKLLGEEAQFHAFKSSKTGAVIHRTAAFSLPKEVAEAVDFVSRTVHFPTAMARSPIVAAVPNADENVTPDFLKKWYNISQDNYIANAKGRVSVFEALGQVYTPTDLAKFQSTLNVHSQTVAKVVGTNTPISCLLNPNNCAEANLDVQYMMAVASGVPMWYWSISSSSQTPFLDWAMQVANTTDAPQVHSISYGGDESTEPKQYADRFNTEVQKMGLRGISVFVSSGDDGVSGAAARQDPSKCGFHPSFPATSPYVTAVGATNTGSDGSSEIVCSSTTGGLITTGGGFSGYFDMPSYQTDAVKNYLANGADLPPLSMFNSTGRAYPDASLLGVRYQVFIDGQQRTLYGTSASSPTLAAMIARINEARLAAGKSTVGFFNPALYKLPADVFKPVTSGRNNACAGPNPDECQYGFTALDKPSSTGHYWAPVDGYGSPVFSRLFEEMMKL